MRPILLALVALSALAIATPAQGGGFGFGQAIRNFRDVQRLRSQQLRNERLNAELNALEFRNEFRQQLRREQFRQDLRREQFRQQLRRERLRQQLNGSDDFGHCTQSLESSCDALFGY